MKQYFILVFLLCICKAGFAQSDIPFAFTSEDDNRLIKEEGENVKYYAATGDTTNVVVLNDETGSYKLFNKEQKLIAEGNFTSRIDKYTREGKWLEYHSNGKVKTTGYYHMNKPIGQWQQFYPGGTLRASYSFAAITFQDISYNCLSGTYQEYYENGKLKMSGCYTVNMDNKGIDTIIVVDPSSGNTIKKFEKGIKPKPEKYGPWEYYNEDGTLEKKDE